MLTLTVCLSVPRQSGKGQTAAGTGRQLAGRQGAISGLQGTGGVAERR